jgi:hypothetical protein
VVTMDCIGRIISALAGIGAWRLTYVMRCRTTQMRHINTFNQNRLTFFEPYGILRSHMDINLVVLLVLEPPQDSDCSHESNGLYSFIESDDVVVSKWQNISLSAQART